MGEGGNLEKRELNGKLVKLAEWKELGKKGVDGIYHIISDMMGFFKCQRDHIIAYRLLLYNCRYVLHVCQTVRLSLRLLFKVCRLSLDKILIGSDDLMI